MKQEKKVNSYLRGIKIIALACVIGSVIGGVTGAIRFVLLSRGVAVSGDWVLQQIRSLLVPILGIIFVVTVILEELCFHKLKGICEKQITAEDEECDQLEYEEEKTGAFGTNLNVLSQVVSIFFLTFGYSICCLFYLYLFLADSICQTASEDTSGEKRRSIFSEIPGAVAGKLR